MTKLPYRSLVTCAIALGGLLVAGCGGPAASETSDGPVVSSSPVLLTPEQTESAADPVDSQLAAATTASSSAAPKPSNKVLLGTDELTSGIPGEGPLTVAEIQA